ncbi:MAG: C_GCAxxG_C_C family protein [Lachnospiraceae bacterium]|jgi:C_GCAxxG_C_C family probable redox protein|nr:C_GCAxxG_C_C family protein [Lachnospiraceae bacterium]
MSESEGKDERAAKSGIDRTGREASERAQEFFREGYNCCQSVFLVFGERYGFDRETACRLSASFGGGVGRLRQICGAVSAMAMVCGLETGAVRGEDQEGKAFNYENVQKLAARFERETGSLICRELLGLDRAGQDEKEKEADEAMKGGMGRFRPQARDERYYASRPCMRLIGLAAEILQRWLDEERRI